MSKPLEGKRIVITRSQSQSAGFAEKLTSLGAAPLFFPTIQFVELSPALDEALARIDQYDWLILTSANAVRIFCRKLNASQPEGDLPPIAVIGSATAKALAQESGLCPAYMPDTFVAEELAAGLGELAHARILLPRSRIGREELVEMLENKGAAVDDIAIYDTTTAEPTVQSLEQIQEAFDAVTFASPSSVRNMLAILDAHDIPRSILNRSAIACIGPVTAEAAQNEGLPVHVVPDEYTVDGLVNSLVVYFTNDNHHSRLKNQGAT